MDAVHIYLSYWDADVWSKYVIYYNSIFLYTMHCNKIYLHISLCSAQLISHILLHNLDDDNNDKHYLWCSPVAILLLWTDHPTFGKGFSKHTPETESPASTNWALHSP